jgi:uncharacterized membrane protein
MRNRWLGFVIAVLAAGASVWAYPRLPPEVPTHWNLAGEPDDYSSRLVAAVLGPVMLVGLTLLFQVLPKIDPRGRNYEKFRDTYWLLVNGVMLFFGAVHLALLANAIGAPVDMGMVFPVGVGLIFIVLGNYLGRVEPNWFIGIRTPWTLESETVWRKTHRIAAWVFVLGGLVVVASALMPGVETEVAFFATLMLAAAVPAVLSYVLWWREQRDAKARRETPG